MIPSLWYLWLLLTGNNISSHYPLIFHQNLFYLYFNLHCEFSFFFNFLFIERQLFYNVVVVSAAQQCKSPVIIYITSLLSLLFASRPHSSRTLQSAWLGSLCYTTSHQLYISHMVVYMSLCYFLHLSHSLLPPLWIFYMFCHLYSDPKIFKYFYLFIWLWQVLFVAHGIFNCNMWDLVPWSGIEPGPPALGAWSLNHVTTSEVPDPKIFEVRVSLCLVLNFFPATTSKIHTQQ